MLPKEFDLNNLDEGIRDLVITLNRIPEVNKKTTVYGPTSCEGHVYESWTKDGWIYFYKPTLKRTGLIRRMNQFCQDFPHFILGVRPMERFDFANFGLPMQPERYGFHQMRGIFEENYIKTELQSEFLRKANIRQGEILSGWKELDSRVKDYIAKNITKDIESLPYISNEEGTAPRPMCPHHCF